MRSIPLWCAAIMAAALAVPATAAAADPLIVTNVTQPALESVPALAPVSATDRGPCDQPLSADEANGAASPCGAAAWPAMGSDWSPSPLQAIGNDRLLLHFGAVPDEVRYSITTNFPPGFAIPGMPQPPGGGPATPPTHVANGAPAPPGPAVAPTPDGADWSITVPSLPTFTPGLDLSVTARTGAAWASYAVGLSTPRILNPGDRCPIAVFSSGERRPEGCSGGVPPGIPSVPTTSAPVAAAPRFVLVGAPRLRGSALALTLQPSVAGTATITLTRTGHPASVLLRATRTLPARATAVHLTVPGRRHAQSLTYKIAFRPRTGTARFTLHGTIARRGR